MKKENIKRNAAIITVVSSLIVAGTGILVEELTDHANEYCPYCGKPIQRYMGNAGV